MAQLVGRDEIESLHHELAEVGRSLRSSVSRHVSSFRANSTRSYEADSELASQWAELDRLPTNRRLRLALVDEGEGDVGKKVVDVTEMGPIKRKVFVEKMIRHIENDNLRLLQKMRKRIDKVGIQLPTVDVRYNKLRVEADCEVVNGKPLPTLWNSLKSSFSFPGLNSQEAKITIIDDISGVIKPGRMTLLLGPPGCGKTTLLKALSGNLSKSLKVSGEVSYNGYKLEEFVPQKTSAYISQGDLHIPELTVRETLDFSARCQGVGTRGGMMAEVSRKEKEAGIIPDPDVDTYMKAISVDGQKTTLQTDYILKILGLDICADTLIGDAMRRGISGGQKKRLTTGEMIVGPTKALFLDEISNGLDSSTTYQIVSCLQQLAHISSATVFLALLQPAPETFDLFDDIVMMAEGKVVYHGPRSHVLVYFEGCGFRCPERKGVADFLQEIMSRKDQEQYWHRSGQPYDFITVDAFSRKFKESALGMKLSEKLANPLLKSNSHEHAISFNKYSLSRWELFRACLSREFLLMRRNSFVYVFKSVQLVISSSIAMTVFLRTRMPVDEVHASYFLGSLFYALMLLFFDGLPELAMTVARLPVFYKQRDLYFYPAWAYAIPAAILKVPLSVLEATIWTCLTYYVIGYTPEVGRFFRHLFLLFASHLAATSLFRFVASTFQTMVVANGAANVMIISVLLFGGFIIPRHSMPDWLRWGFWISPLSYGELGLSLNEFLSPRWQKILPSNTTIGNETLKARGLYYGGNYYWVSLGVLFGMAILFNIGFTLTLTFLNPPGSRAIISREKLSKLQGSDDSSGISVKAKSLPARDTRPQNGRMVLPFEPLSIVFEDIQYYVDTPLAMKDGGYPEKKLQLLHDITGAFRPGVLTALMGVSGAGKTTLLDVLAGRKNSGIVKGDIRVGGYPKVQESFARISGYCEQTDVHSPQVTIEESLLFSAWLRLDRQIDTKTKHDFVKEVLATIELEEIKDSLVGLPGLSGLSTEQRKRLTVAVELVANPSIIFMDEPTTGLDARAAAIVMRAVKNVADTGRTIVCTIHQPSIDIFEAFDELLLLKAGGHVIYSGELGSNSSSIIKYFEDIPDVPKIKDNYNPATWMLEVTSVSAEAELSLDFAQIYKNSVLHQKNQELAKSLRLPPPGSKELYFPRRFSTSGWEQFKCCLWKQNLSYWRSPSYNVKRGIYVLMACLFLGFLFWDKGTKIHDQQSLFTVFGALYIATILLGINNSSSVLPYVSTERSVLYRERFSGMYSPWAFGLAQVTVEIPYLAAQSIVFLVITYPMIGFYGSAYKIFWYFYTMFCNVMTFSFLGMVLVAITPNFQVAAIIQSVFYTTFTLFAGFFLPRPKIPNWWLWMYYGTPASWALNAFISSQYGDVHREISVFGETQTIADFVKNYFGFHHDQLPLVSVILLLFPILLATMFAYFVGKLNFQRR